MVKRTIRLVEEGFVWALIDEIKIVYESMKTRIIFKDAQGFLVGHLVPAVDEVDTNTGGKVSSRGLGDENIGLALSHMD
jgi:hypothetical protein